MDAGVPLAQLVDRGIPYVTSPMGRGVIPDDHPMFMNSARSAALESVLEAAKGTRLRIGSFVPNAIALYAAYLHAAPEAKGWTLVANVGAENTDVALVSGTDLSFARNLAGGGRARIVAALERLAGAEAGA
jgi:thiamine pyrophosphate-dependent acetolactate synthase large subunit-like protein